jgi:hypothetical protein
MAVKSDDLLPRIDRRTLVSGLALLPAAGEGWLEVVRTVISMKNDWKRILAFD